MCLSTTSRAIAASACLIATVSTAGAEPTLLGDYYEDKATLSCPSDSFNCRLNFSRTPKREFLTLRRIACYIERNQPLRIVSFGAADKANGLTSRSIPVEFSANTTGNGSYYYSINQDLFYKMPPARFPLVSIETSAPSSGFVSCTITGTLSDQ